MEPRPGMRLPLELQVGTEGFTAGAGDKELLDHSAIQRLRQRLLSGRRRRRDRDMVGGQHELVVEGSGSVEEWPGGGVARVQATAARQRSTEGGDVGSSGVSGNVPQAKPAGGRGEGGLQPGFGRQRPRAKAFQAGTNSCIKINCGLAKKLWGRDTHGKNHPAEGSTVTQQQEPCLRVRELTQCFQEGLRLVDALGMGVGFSVSRRPNRSAKKVHSPVLADLHPVREGPLVNSTVRAGAVGKDTLARVELQANLAAGGGKAGQACSDLLGPASKVAVIQESKGKFRLLPRTAGRSGLESRVQGQCKQERAEWVALLDSSFRGEGGVVEEKPGMVVVAPLGPWRETRHMQADLPKHRSTINSVEGIAEINLQKALIDMTSVALHPLPGSVDGSLRTEGHSHTNLERPKVLGGWLTQCAAETLAGKAAPGFADSDGPKVTGPFGKSVKGGSCKVGSECKGGLSPYEETDHFGEVCRNLVGVDRGQGLSDVIPSKTSRARGAAALEAPGCLYHSF